MPDTGPKGPQQPRHTIRQATPADHEEVSFLIADLADTTEKRSLSICRVREAIQAVSRDSFAQIFVACRPDDKLVGMLILGGYEHSTWFGGTRLWVTDVFVDPRARRQGVFRDLYSEARRSAKRTPGVVGLRLCVLASNLPAHETYDAVGMDSTNYVVWKDDFEDDRDENEADAVTPTGATIH